MARILIVDDSKELCDAIQHILQFKGHETTLAHTGADAVTRALADHPDLIIMDLQLPDIYGYDAIRKIREDTWGKDAKLLILTASGEVDKIPPEIGVTKDDYLMKAQWGIENIAQKVAEKLGDNTPAPAQ